MDSCADTHRHEAMQECLHSHVDMEHFTRQKPTNPVTKEVTYLTGHQPYLHGPDTIVSRTTDYAFIRQKVCFHAAEPELKKTNLKHNAPDTRNTHAINTWFEII